VRYRYGDRQLGPDRGGESDVESQRSEQVARTSLAAVYDLQAEPDSSLVEMAVRALEAQPRREPPADCGHVAFRPEPVSAVGECPPTHRPGRAATDSADAETDR
jgi:hypothetical protein